MCCCPNIISQDMHTNIKACDLNGGVQCCTATRKQPRSCSCTATGGFEHELEGVPLPPDTGGYFVIGEDAVQPSGRQGVPGTRASRARSCAWRIYRASLVWA